MRSKRVNPVEYLPTAADYIAKGLCPFLIMVLVGSLAMFVQEATYSGPHELRLKWLIFWCVLAIVGISRIAIEKTPAYAGMYALALGLVGYMFVTRFFEIPLIGWLILAVIWWCTNKLVYDCTLIDDKDDASGEGLLGVAGIDETDDREKEAPATSNTKPKKVSLWKRIFTNARAKNEQPHAPGLWVLYFSLAALPVFGFGQPLMTRYGTDGFGVFLVLAYLIAAIALLMLTSFLGLRRYLRQRRLKMPGAMASRWMAMGVGILLLVLFVSLFLPRPLPRVAAVDGSFELTGKVLEDDRYVEGGEGENDETEGEGGATERGEERREDGAGDAEGEVDDSQLGNDRQGDGKSAEGQNEAPGAMPNFLGNDWVRRILWGLFALAVLVFAWKHRREILQSIRDLMEALKNLFRRESKPRKKRSKDGGRSEMETETPVRVFAELSNPFAGGAEALAPDAVVTMTYDALEVWAAELGCPRDRQMTANEFARELTYRHPEARSEINRLVSLHAGRVYADRMPTNEELPPLARLWSYMESRSTAGLPQYR